MMGGYDSKKNPDRASRISFIIKWIFMKPIGCC